MPDESPRERSLMGAYGSWAAGLYVQAPGRLSLRAQSEPLDLEAWRAAAVARTRALLAEPPAAALPSVRRERQWVHEGLLIEDLRWQLPYGPPTRAYFLKPAAAAEPLPGFLALHDHGGRKRWGRIKLAHAPEQPVTPLLRAHRDYYYGGAVWAQEVARAGFAVLVHDAFAFGSRRVLENDYAGRPPDDATSGDPQTETYDRWAARHEHVMAKSLFAAGLTWPGMVLYEDRTALDALCARDDVDPARVGCGGLSGGGLRTVFLGGLDPRIRAAVCVGMMSTWRDYVLHRSDRHTWMTFVPHLARDLDYPEILGLRTPKPTLVLNNLSDPLFTLAEMHRADAQLRAAFQRAGRPENYESRFFEGGHKFDRAMQDAARAFLRRHLQR